VKTYYFCGSMLFRRHIIKFVVIALLSVVASSCSKFGRIMKSDDSEAKYAAALKYYNKKDYHRAGLLFDDLLPVYRTTARAEEVYYYHTYCKYYMYEISSAAFHFRNFYETYPNSQYAEECFYMYAYCNYVEAYPYNLDPTYTLKAIDEFQLFVNVFPHSKYVAECNKLIDECRHRLQVKAYKTAKLYYNIEDYKAAIVSFRNLLRDYPDIEEKEEIEYLIVKSAFKYAEQSIDKKKAERYTDVIKASDLYKDSWPQGQYIKDVKDYAEKAKERLTKLENNKKENSTQL